MRERTYIQRRHHATDFELTGGPFGPGKPVGP